MNIIEPMVMELKQEAQTTRRYLERIPHDKLGWKPHAKSMSMGQLASHLCETCMWVGALLDTEELVFDPEQYQPFHAKTRVELLDAFDKNIALALEKMEGQSDEAMMQVWRMRSPDRVFFEMPRMAVLRAMILNHLVHHRGQLSVYLRLNDVTVPATYGPSADEESPS